MVVVGAGAIFMINKQYSVQEDHHIDRCHTTTTTMGQDNNRQECVTEYK